jgi:uncharacterized repeat protein (TIGR03943 family)
MKRVFEFTIIFMVGMYIQFLNFTGGLSYYIHPRYFDFTYVGGTVCVFVGIVGIIYYLKNAEKVKRNEFFKSALSVSRAYVFILILLIIGFLIPPQTLSSRAAGNRFTETELGFAQREVTVYEKFAKDDASLSIEDWVNELKFNSDPETFVGRELDITGFVFLREDIEEDSFLISRFVVRCCVVDATPIGLKVKKTSEFNFKEDTWINVKGSFEVEDDNTLIVIPESVNQVEVPDNPYIF